MRLWAALWLPRASAASAFFSFWHSEVAMPSFDTTLRTTAQSESAVTPTVKLTFAVDALPALSVAVAVYEWVPRNEYAGPVMFAQVFVARPERPSLATHVMAI